MPAAERDWAKEPLPAERIQTKNSKNPVEGSDEWELTMTGEGYRMKRAEPTPQLGWTDVLFWAAIVFFARVLFG